MKRLTVREAAIELGVSYRRMYQLLAEGRVKGAKKHSGVWLVPSPVRVFQSLKGPLPGFHTIKR